MPIRSVGKSLFRKNVNKAVANLARAKKMNPTKKIDNHGALEINLRGEVRESNARRRLKEEAMKRRIGFKGFTRIIADEYATKRLIRLKKFQATKAKKDAKFN